MEPETTAASGAPSERLYADAPASFDADARSVTVMFNDGSGVWRYDWMREERYELRIPPAGMDLSRLNAGAGVFVDHRSWSLEAQVGVVERAWVEGGKAYARLRFADDEKAAFYAARVRDGVIRNVSMGVFLLERERERPEGSKFAVVTATRSQPYEISFVGVPAIAGAQTLSAAPGAGADHDGDGAREKVMSKDVKEAPAPEAGDKAAALEAQLAAERKAREEAERRAAELEAAQLEAARVADVDAAIAAFSAVLEIDEAAKAALRAPGVSVHAAREKLQAMLAARPEQAPIAARTAASAVDRRDRDAFCAAAAEAILWRNGMAELTAQSRDLRGQSLVDLARLSLARSGVSTAGMTADEVAREAFAHGSGDFPLLLENTMHKSLSAGYQAAEVVFPMVSRRTVVRDFRAHNFYRLGDMPRMQRISEDGSYPQGTFGEAKESITVQEYGYTIAVTRKMIVNDDLGAFTDVPAAMGRTIRDDEEQLWFAALLSNTGAGPLLRDGTGLMHTNRGNVAGTGAHVSEATLTEARVAMMSFKGVGDAAKRETARYIRVSPRYLLISPTEFSAAEKVAASVLASAEMDVNIERGKWTILASPYLLVGGAADPWFAFADPASVPAMRHAYLEGRDAPMIETRQGWTHTGAEIRLTHDFGVAGDDWRGVWKNPGTT